MHAYGELMYVHTNYAGLWSERGMLIDIRLWQVPCGCLLMSFGKDLAHPQQ